MSSLLYLTYVGFPHLNFFGITVSKDCRPAFFHHRWDQHAKKNLTQSMSIIFLKEIIFYFVNIRISIYCLWNLSLCCASPFREALVIPHMLHGRTIPLMWLASMWLVMFLNCPSFPHTLQILALSFPFGIRFSLTSIIDFTFSANLFSFVKDNSVFSERALSFIVCIDLRWFSWEIWNFSLCKTESFWWNGCFFFF